MSDATRPRAAEPRIALDDVDDLIHTATRLMQKDAAPETLTADDVRRIGAELDIPAEYVDQALAKLEAQRQEEARAKQEAARQRELQRAKLRRWALGAVMGLAVVGLGAGVGTVSLRNGMRGSLAEVTRQRAQVHNVVERRERVQARYATSTPGPERDAQLSGADNRVSVEQRRYDEAATRYNAAASSFPSSWVVGGPDLPSAVPLSTEISLW